MRRHAIRRHSRDLLRSLGDSSPDVAASLEAVGVRGVPCSPYDCALARYLNAILPAEAGIEEVGVGVLSPWAMKSHLKVRRGPTPRRPIWVELPPAVNQFLADFDGGRFPALRVPVPAPGPSAPSSSDSSAP